MAFNNPAWLWGLAGLLIPLAIHLLSRKEGQVIKIGSLRFLTETPTQQFKSIKLNEIFLLILRLCIVGLLVLFLSELMMNSNNSKERWILIDPQLKESKFLKPLIDSLRGGEEKRDLKLLQPGFPDYETNTTTNGSPNYWAAVEDLKQESVNEAIILSASKFSGFFGDRVSKSDNIIWITVPTEEISQPVLVNRFAKDSVRVTQLVSNESLSQFRSKEVFWPESKSYYRNDKDSILIDTSTTNILIHFDNEFSHDAKIVFQSLAIIRQQTRFSGAIAFDEQRDYKNYNCLIWLSNDAPPEFKGKSISFRPSESESLLIKTEADGWTLTHRLNSNLAITKHLPLELASIILQNSEDSIIRTNDQRVMPENMMWSSLSGETKQQSNQKSAASYLMLMLMILFALERTVAHIRKS